MFVSQGMLVNYAGWQKRTKDLGNNGRGAFVSVRGKFIVVVVGSGVYKITTTLLPTYVGKIDSSIGDVFIDENLAQQICIVDKIDAYIYDYADSAIITRQNLPFNPNYVVYHNTFFLFGSTLNSVDANQWYVYQKNGVDSTTISLVTTLSLQTKPDAALAVIRIPGGGNNVMVFGQNVAEIYNNVGGTENYRRVSSFNLDNGVKNVATIGYSDNSIFWLGQNEKGTLTIFESNGQNAVTISDDGLNKMLENMKNPDKSTGFCYKQDGHLFYQLTFYDSRDNVTIVYDAKEKEFYFATDERFNYYPARKVVNFNNTTYFISLNDGSLYEMGDEFLDYNYDIDETVDGYEIPRWRYTNSVRQVDGEPFIIERLGFIIEQGVTYYQPGDVNIPRVDIAMTKNGGISFGTFVNTNLNPSGGYKNIMEFRQLGYANEVGFLIKFLGRQRFVVGNAVLEVS